VSRPELVELKK
jgi:hypothetical protein